MPRVSFLGVGGGLNHLCEVEVPEMFDGLVMIYLVREVAFPAICCLPRDNCWPGRPEGCVCGILLVRDGNLESETSAAGGAGVRYGG